MAIREMSCVGERLNAMRLRLVISHEIDSIQTRLKPLRVACEELRSSPKLARVFEVLLGMANAINAKRASGFRLSSLDTLLQTKSPHEPTLSLLHFLVRALIEQHPELCDFYCEVGGLAVAAPIDPRALTSEVQVLESHLHGVTGVLTQTGIEPGFVRELGPFLERDAPQAIGALRAELDATLEVVSATQSYFGEEQTPLKQMLDTITKFVSSYKVVKAEFEEKAARKRMAAGRAAGRSRAATVV